MCQARAKHFTISADLIIPQLCEISTIIVSNLKKRKTEACEGSVSMKQQGRLHGHETWAVSRTGPCDQLCI